MAAKKSGNKRKLMGNVSGRTFFFGLSVAANIGFVVALITMMTTHVLDGMFMNEGLSRYCATENDDKFSTTSEKVRALRQYTCASGDADKYFEAGFQQYLDYKNIK